MLCPFCSSRRTKVATQQLGPEGTVTRIRRCDSCEKNFTTIEVPCPARLTDFQPGCNPEAKRFSWWLNHMVERFDEDAA